MRFTGPSTALTTPGLLYSFSSLWLEQKGLCQVSLLFQTIFLWQHFNTHQFQLSVMLEDNLVIAENKMMTISVSAAWCRAETENVYQSLELGPAWCRTESHGFYHSILKWWQDTRKYTEHTSPRSSVWEPGWNLKWIESMHFCGSQGHMTSGLIIGSGDVCGSWQ